MPITNSKYSAQIPQMKITIIIFRTFDEAVVSVCQNIVTTRQYKPKETTMEKDTTKALNKVFRIDEREIRSRLDEMVREGRRRTKWVGAFPDGHWALMLVAARLRHVSATR